MEKVKAVSGGEGKHRIKSNQVADKQSQGASPRVASDQPIEVPEPNGHGKANIPELASFEQASFESASFELASFELDSSELDSQETANKNQYYKKPLNN